jgi:hypothetical protein
MLSPVGDGAKKFKALLMTVFNIFKRCHRERLTFFTAVPDNALNMI